MATKQTKHTLSKSPAQSTLHVKIREDLHRGAKAAAAQRGISLKALIEEKFVEVMRG